jgi:hypothetical protein
MHCHLCGPHQPSTLWLHPQDILGQWHQIWFDDEATLSVKYGLAASRGLRGVGVWAVNYLPYGDPWLGDRAESMWAVLAAYAILGSQSRSGTPTPSRTASSTRTPVSQSPVPSLVVSANNLCGAEVLQRCPGSTLCCSQFGFCGAGAVSGSCLGRIGSAGERRRSGERQQRGGARPSPWPRFSSQSA